MSNAIYGMRRSVFILALAYFLTSRKDTLRVLWEEEEGVCLVFAALFYLAAEYAFFLRRKGWDGPTEGFLRAVYREGAMRGWQEEAEGDIEDQRWRPAVLCKPARLKTARFWIERHKPFDLAAVLFVVAFWGMYVLPRAVWGLGREALKKRFGLGAPQV